MIPCAPVELRAPAPKSASFFSPAPTNQLPGYAAELEASPRGWVTLPLWCVWVEPPGFDMWSNDGMMLLKYPFQPGEHT